MRNKWCKYVLMLAVVLCGTYAGGMLHEVFARQAEQTEEVSGSDRDYLQWQLKQMEESFQRQQEQIQALKNRVGEVSEKVYAGSDAVPAADVANKDLGKIVDALKGFKIGGLWYLSYQNGDTGNTTGGTSFNAVNIKRGYLTVEKEFFPWFSSRITSDVTTVKDPASNLDGSLALRIKYLYALFKAPDMVFLTKPNVEVGVVHNPWFDFEEKLNYYRLQDTMFIERNSILNSADQGLTFTTLLGGLVDEKYQKEVNAAYPGRYGSIQAGIYNGGGYEASEKNSNKVLEGRVTVRPLPDIIPGLQLTYFGITGKGNTTQGPAWDANLAFASFEHKYVVLTGQYFWGKGNQKGTDENDKRGYSFFTELKPHKKVSVISRFDHFDPDTNVSDNENNRYIAGVAYHIDRQHNNMILLDYDTVHYEKSGMSDDKRVQLTWQVAF
ncbi:MAG: hypothetical protein KGJ87_01710 [Planctomycetota bacterium]|nr:hypothetical protein [Planctomycetota bacterium]MDE1889821.1 hypothetical protein [Planctomycetota bacterium]MDE2215872.1 hypothetical protein [Planctomycetota bacterium]